MAKPIPEGYHSVTPYLIIKGATEAIDFYKKAFGASELFRMPAPGGKIGHAEIKIGDSPIMLADDHKHHDLRRRCRHGVQASHCGWWQRTTAGQRPVLW